MSIAGLIFLIIAHYLCGSGLLHLFHTDMNRTAKAALSVISGIVILSLVPFILQLLYIPITLVTTVTGILVLCLLTNITRIRSASFNVDIKHLKLRWPSVRIYELPFMLVFGVILFASAWRSFYFPPFSRDMLSGPEVIAKYTVAEHTMINSVFTVNLESTNNHQKPPYVTGLQIIYKLMGFPFGQVWVSIIAMAFCIFLYRLLRERVHPVIAGTLMLLFLAIPELYAYTYIMLFDYSNMVLFFIATCFLLAYFKSGSRKEFYLSALFYGFATIVRLETLVFTALMVPLFWVYAFRNKLPWKRIILQSCAMIGFSFLFYFLWVNIYLQYYMPQQFHLDGQINPRLGDLTPLFTRFIEMNSRLLSGTYATALWAHFINVFLVVTILDLIFTKKFTREALFWLYAIAVVYVELPLLGYLLPLVDLMNTTKRGLFKIMPMMIMVLANNGILRKLSSALYAWENDPGKKEQAL